MHKAQIKKTRFFIVMAYLLMIYMDISGSPAASYLKWGAIFACWQQAIFFFHHSNHTGEAFLMYALALTFICDYFLLFTASYTIGMLLFSVVHLFHARRMNPSMMSKMKKGIPFLALPLFFCLLFPPYAEIAAGAGYAFCFGLHIVCTIKSRHRYPQSFFIQTLGSLFLFLLCDICVLLFYITNTKWLGILIWVFYLPSQYLLATTPYWLLYKTTDRA